MEPEARLLPLSDALGPTLAPPRPACRAAAEARFPTSIYSFALSWFVSSFGFALILRSTALKFTCQDRLDARGRPLAGSRSFRGAQRDLLQGRNRDRRIPAPPQLAVRREVSSGPTPAGSPSTYRK